MAAKPVIDLQASVDDLDEAARAFDAPLAALGFTRLAFEHDHVPAGMTDDPDRWTKRLWTRPGEAYLHVRLRGAPAARRALLFRDWFRRHPEPLPAYARFKRDLAAAVADRTVYTDVKDPVVDLVIAVAERWARHTSWTP